MKPMTKKKTTEVLKDEVPTNSNQLEMVVEASPPVAPSRADNETSAKVQSNLLSSQILELEAGPKYFSMIEKVKMVARGTSHALMVMGHVGVAKSTIVKETLTSEGLQEGKDFVFMRGFSTPMALYEKLFQNRETGKVLVIDDCDAVIKNKTSLDLLKAVLDDKYQRVVNYETRRKGSDLPKSFVYGGRVIFITNYQPKESDIHFLAIQDRCLVQKVYLSAREKLEYIEKILVPADYKSTTLEDRKMAFNFMRDAVVEGGIHFSYRHFYQILDFYKHDRENFHVHLRELVPVDTDTTLLLRLRRERPNDREFWMTRFMELTGKSRRTYFYALEKVRDILPSTSGDFHG